MAYRKTEFVENKRRETRECIVSTARRLVETGGWSNCTLIKVAEDAGVSSGSIYTHFETVAYLYIEVFLNIADEEVSVIADIASSNASPLDRMVAGINTFSRRALRGRTKAYAVIAEPVVAEVDAVRQNYRARFVDQYEQIIADGVEAGVFRTQNPRVSGSCIVGALAETLVKPLSSQVDELPDNGKQIQAEILSFCLHAIGLDEHNHQKLSA